MSGAKTALSALVGVVLLGGGVSTLGQLTSAQEHVRSSSADPPYRVAVESSTGDVTVVVDPHADRVSAEGSIVRGFATPTWGFRERDGWLVFGSSCDGPGFPSPCGADWTLTVPGGRIVDVRSGGGDVDLAGAFVSASVTADAGDVEVLVPEDGATYRVSGETRHGERRVDLPTALAHGDVRDLQLSTTTGDVSVSTD